jgi:hypothetical protein
MAKGVTGIVSNPAAFRSGTLAYKRRVIEMILHEVFSYRDWTKVLAHFGLKPESVPRLPAPQFPTVPDSLGQSAGEGPDIGD